MKRFLSTIVLVLVIFACVWALWNKDKISNPADALRLAKSQFDNFTEDRGGRDQTSAQFASWTNPGGGSTSSAPVDQRDFIRIATFNVQTFGNKKSNDRVVMSRLADICRNFDLIALQEIRNVERTVLPNFVRDLNAGGGQYDFAVSPRLGRSNQKEQTAFIYDRTRIQLDDSFSYTINDPDDVLRREPFVGWFRARGPHLENAFTFTLANFHLDPKRPDLELAYLAELHRIIRKDGRDEDDVILLGDFNSGDRGLELAGEKAGLEWVVSNTATNTRGTNQYDNIIFDPRATDEFTGSGGVFDVMKEMNLTMQDALAISDHLPVWAEFSIFEAGRRVVAQGVNNNESVR